MDIKAVVYSSKRQWINPIVKELARQRNLPCIDIKNIQGFSFQEVPVLFCTTVKKGKLQDLSLALKLFRCTDVHAVGYDVPSEEFKLYLKQKNYLENRSFTYQQVDHKSTWKGKGVLDNREYTV